MDRNLNPNPPEIILVVDDEKDIVELTALYLKDTGFKIVGAASGTEALDFLSENSGRVAMVILDILMPGTSGYEVCKAIRSDEKMKYIPILIQSGLMSVQDRVHAMEAGGDDFINKPPDKILLQTRVKSLARIGRLYAELLDRNRRLESSIEKLKAAQEEIIQNEKYASFGNLLQGLVHEIYNPITIISGSVDRINMRLAKGTADREFFDEVTQSIKNASRRCVVIVDSLKMYFSDEKGKLEYTNFNDILMRLVMVFEAKYLLRHNITFVQKYDESLPLVRCDRYAMNKALMNILINAQESIGHSGRITVSTGYDGTCVYIYVSDTGPGFSEDFLNHAFEPFFTTKKVGVNSGLGLPTTFGIIRSHGGEVTVFNNEGGRGAVVSIKIPAGSDITRPIEAADGCYENT